MNTRNTQPMLISLFLFSLSACGADVMRPNMPASPTTPMPEVLTDRVTLTLDRISSTNDCDPAKGNPGDFEITLEAFVKEDFQDFGAWDLIEASSGRSLTLNAEKGERRTASVGESISVDLPRRDDHGLFFQAHVAEKDGGSEDVRLTGGATYYFDADIDCWYSVEGHRCGSGSFSKSRTYREDEFHLFNSDDEGCQIAMRWSVTFARD